MENSRKIFGKIYDKYIDKIYRFVYLKVNAQETAEDLTSEAFLKTWKVFKKKGKEIENIQAFLYKTARNLVTDHYRQKGKITIISAMDPLIADPRCDLEEKAKLNSDMEKVKITLSDLKEDYQNVIIWHYMEGLSVGEISKILGKKVPNTRVLLHRALKSLKDKIEEV
jgi:RNA polymerase sigma-70 factor (ECF subfamily)